MAETKVLNTRIKVRYDTLANWNSNNPFLLKGEIAIVEIPANTSAGVVISEPAYLMKVGTGVETTVTVSGVEMKSSQFKALPYVTAQAGDVYAWAKKATGEAGDIAVTDTAGNYTKPQGDDYKSLEKIIADLYSKINATDTNTTYELELGTGENAGKIRLNYKDLDDADFTDGDWVAVGTTVTADDDSILVDTTTTAGTSAVSVQISAATGNALELNTTAGEKGLFVHETTVNDPVSANASSSNTVDVVTAIAQDNTNKYQLNLTKETMYTKERIDQLLNPGMEFKGVETAANLDAITLTSAMLGDSYKVSTAGTAQLTDPALQGAKAGDLAIVVEGSTSGTYEWALIPAGDDVEDTYRAIQINGVDFLDNTLGSGSLNIVGTSGIVVSNDHGDLCFEIDENEVALADDLEALAAHAGYGEDAGADQLLVGGSQASVKEYVDDKFDGALTGVTASIASESAGVVTIKAGLVKDDQDVANSSASDITLAKLATTANVEDLVQTSGDWITLDGGNASSFAAPVAQNGNGSEDPGLGG